ncbi:MAG: 50S ribosomal protein L24 [Candidatus Hadarchaeales archaeon]
MGSTKPRKQRLAIYSCPLHMRKRFLHAQLSPELSEKYGKRSARIRKGDRVIVMAGDFKKMEGDVLEVNSKLGIIHVEGVLTTKSDGTQVPRPIKPSKVMITKMVEDRKREKTLKRGSKVGQ